MIIGGGGAISIFRDEIYRRRQKVQVSKHLRGGRIGRQWCESIQFLYKSESLIHIAKKWIRIRVHPRVFALF